MKYDPVLAAMLAEPWSNNACRGYVIYAMENCGFSSEDIRRVVGELHYIFDFKTLEAVKAKAQELGAGLSFRDDLSPLFQPRKVGGRTAPNSIDRKSVV